jgi:hypothetical protein
VDLLAPVQAASEVFLPSHLPTPLAALLVVVPTRQRPPTRPLVLERQVTPLPTHSLDCLALRAGPLLVEQEPTRSLAWTRQRCSGCWDWEVVDWVDLEVVSVELESRAPHLLSRPIRGRWRRDSNRSCCS